MRAMGAGALCLSLALLSCAVTTVNSESGTVIKRVPFFPQESRQCGPASLAGVLNYWAVDVTPEEIAGAIYSGSAGGTLDMDMVFYAEGKGLKASLYRGSVEDLRENIDSGRPVIVMVDYGFWAYRQGHFMVIAGYREDGVIANTGREQLKFIPYEKFIRSWEKTDFWSLLITPG
jgi:predicted double-glycine peptidase